MFFTEITVGCLDCITLNVRIQPNHKPIPKLGLLPNFLPGGGTKSPFATQHARIAAAVCASEEAELNV